MSLCPEFWCSKCSVRHADKCPPARKGVTVTQEELDALAKALTPKNYYSTPAGPPPIGSWWDIQDFDSHISLWVARGIIYEVLAVDLVAKKVDVIVITHAWAGNRYTLELDAFTAVGHSGSRSGHYRMIQVPAFKAIP